ncbi:hypothetical protein GQ457_07G000450 [Hibiscus cannabinus]
MHVSLVLSVTVLFCFTRRLSLAANLLKLNLFGVVSFELETFLNRRYSKAECGSLVRHHSRSGRRLGRSVEWRQLRLEEPSALPVGLHSV